jgi:hypothetical protein
MAADIQDGAQADKPENKGKTGFFKSIRNFFRGIRDFFLGKKAPEVAEEKDAPVDPATAEATARLLEEELAQEDARWQRRYGYDHTENSTGLVQLPGKYHFLDPERAKEEGGMLYDVRSGTLVEANIYHSMLSDGTPGQISGNTVVRPKGWESIKRVGLAVEGAGPKGERLLDTTLNEIEKNVNNLVQLPGEYYFFSEKDRPGIEQMKLHDVRNGDTKITNCRFPMLSDAIAGAIVGGHILRPVGAKDFKLVGMAIDKEFGVMEGSNRGPTMPEVDGGFEYKGLRHFGRQTLDDVKRHMGETVDPAPAVEKPAVEQEAKALDDAAVQQKKAHEKAAQKQHDHAVKNQKVDPRGHGGDKHKGGHHHQRHGR